MGRFKIFLIILVILALLVGTGFLVNYYLTKGETQKYETENNYYWTITKNRTSLKGALLDQLQIFTKDNKLVFDSDTVKPIFEGNPETTIAFEDSKEGTTFKQTFSYDFAKVTFSLQLFNNQKYADIETEIKYLQDKASQFEGIELALDGMSKTAYFDETYTKQDLGAKKVQISQWSPHILETGSKYKATLTDNTAEVMELAKTLNNTNVKLYSYYGPTRENVFARNFEDADKAEPKIDTNIKRTKGETVNLSQRLFVGPDSLSYLPFRYPYAKDSVVSLVSHADWGTIKDIENEGLARLLTVFYGSSDPTSPDYGKKGIFSHNLRVTFTVFAVKDAKDVTTNGSVLEVPKFKSAIQELYRRGVDIGAHRLTANGIGEYLKSTPKIEEAFALLANFSPTVWIDHHIRDCNTESRQENIAGCASLQNNRLYLMDYLKDGTWQYLWASGQDAQAGGDDYALNAFEDFIDASRVLYYYQGEQNALIPGKLMTFTSSYAYTNKEFSEDDLNKLSAAKGFHNVHAYFVANSDELDNASLKKDSDGNTYWRASNHLERGLKMLEEFQAEDKVWVRDFTTVADYLRAWQNIKITDFTSNSITIQNQGGNAINGLTLYNPSSEIATAKSGDIYYPYIRDNYVVLSKLEKGETRTIEFGGDKNIPQITSFSDKHIEISEVSYLKTDNNIKITIAPSGKPGQDLVVGDTDIKIKLSGSIDPKITRDGAAYSNFSIKDKELTITTDTNAHSFQIQL